MQIIKPSKTRERILGKIRNAIRNSPLPMPYPEVEKESANTAFTNSGLSDEENFASAFIKLGGKFVYCYNEADLAENLHLLIENNEWQKVLCAEPHLLKLFEQHQLPIAAITPTVKEAEVCITSCEAIAARTGSVIFSSRQFIGRAAPVYYPIHIIVAYSNQVMPDINAGLELMKAKYGTDLPSMINFNTGPSRTADIEKTLVVGVHGPAEVYCFYIDA